MQIEVHKARKSTMLYSQNKIWIIYEKSLMTSYCRSLKKNREKRMPVNHKYKLFRIHKRLQKWKGSLELKELELHTK